MLNTEILIWNKGRVLCGGEFYARLFTVDKNKKKKNDQNLRKKLFLLLENLSSRLKRLSGGGRASRPSFLYVSISFSRASLSGSSSENSTALKTSPSSGSVKLAAEDRG